MASAGYRHVAFRAPGTPAPAGCEDGTAPFTCGAAADAAPGPAAAPARTGRTTGADAQVPKDFTQAAQGLWAGCPSLVRVRVALPDASKRGRGIIRNDATGKTVTATLLGRKRGNPGPSIQVSSGRGRVGGLAAGRPATVMIAALRRKEETPVTPGAAAERARTRAVETGPGDPGAVPAVTGTAEARAGAPVADAGLPVRAGPGQGRACRLCPCQGRRDRYPAGRLDLRRHGQDRACGRCRNRGRYKRRRAQDGSRAQGLSEHRCQPCGRRGRLRRPDEDNQRAGSC